METSQSGPLSAARRRFSSVAIALHWITVALIIGLFGSAWSFSLASGRPFAPLLLVHRSLGALAWVTAIARLMWRLGFAPPPPFPASMPRL
jgi:cytochrome b561